MSLVVLVQFALYFATTAAVAYVLARQTNTAKLKTAKNSLTSRPVTEIAEVLGC